MVQTVQMPAEIPQFRVLDKVVCEPGVCPHGPGSAGVEQVEQAPPSQIVPHHRLSPWTEQGSFRLVSQGQQMPIIQKIQKTVEIAFLRRCGERTHCDA